MSRLLFVSHLPPTMTIEMLRLGFEQSGHRVRRASVVRDRTNGRPRGFGFVEIETDGNASHTIAPLSGQVIAGQPWVVSEVERSAKNRTEQRHGRRPR